VHPVGSYCTDISRCTVNKTLKENKVLLKIIAELLSLVMCLIKKPPVPTKRVTVSLIKVQSCTALLRTPLVCTSSYLK